MNEIKVGDWVILTYSDGYITTIQRLIGISEDFYEFDHTINGRHAAKIKFSILELWQPKQGEWCWSKTYGLVEIVDTLPITITVKPVVLYIQTQVTVDDLEPFIGKLPFF